MVSSVVNTGIYGGYNSYDTSRRTLLQGRFANGSTEGYEFSTFADTGYDFHFGNLSLGRVFAAQYTNVHIDGYTERASFVPLNIHSDSEECWRTDLGIQASYTWHVGNITIIPSLRAAWEHEYKYSRLPITFGSVDFPGVSATTFGPHEGDHPVTLKTAVDAVVVLLATCYRCFFVMVASKINGRVNDELRRDILAPLFLGKVERLLSCETRAK